MEKPQKEKLEEMGEDLINDGGEDNPCSAGCEVIADQSPEKYARIPKHVKCIEDVVKDHALQFLPAKSLYRFKTVSKEWNKWIKNPFFAHSQTNHFKDVSGLFLQFPDGRPSFISLDPTSFGIPSDSLSFLPEQAIDIRSTCNGLLCCQSRHGNESYYICNPVTKNWRRLPNPNFYHPPGTAVALAFEPSVYNFTANYELICVVPLPESPVLHFEIYSSRSNSWRISETVCCVLDALALNNDGFYMRGVAYWETQSGAVLAFNVKYEYFGILNLPPCSGPTGALTEMHGNLCYIMSRKQEEDDNYIIEVYGDMNMSLKHVIPISPQVAASNTAPMCRAVCFVNDDTLILDLDGKIIAYHATKNQAKCLRNGMNKGFGKFLPYVNSLVSVRHSALSKYSG
ncbi:hypothetical protein JCGZ_05166 [Jatropha curcas]|uniref:F-box domain-containing protein n=2 Tax=Jatropha curcas TaxID=180498 RepID=A0A067L1C7_JATCU|nr:hypothetical protein JCGZ_05166 [Jatropha curcas]